MAATKKTTKRAGARRGTETRQRFRVELEGYEGSSAAAFVAPFDVEKAVEVLAAGRKEPR